MPSENSALRDEEVVIEVLEVGIEVLDVGIANDKEELGEKHDVVGDGKGVGVDDIVDDKGIVGEKHEQVGEHWEGGVYVEEVAIEVEVLTTGVKLSAGVKLDRRLSHDVSPSASLAAAGEKDAAVLW